ncbi:MAG: glycosyltransferase family 39 protein [Patescibacteria group bacterium]
MNNIQTNFDFLRTDFISFAIHQSGIIAFLSHIVLAAGIFLTLYLVGEKLRLLFFSNSRQYAFFINFALGYILIGSGFGLLGLLSLLKTEIIWAYLFVITAIALYPFSIKKIISRFFIFVSQAKNLRFKDFAIWGVILFILLSFLRLIPPEITEDAYHTDLPHLYLMAETSMLESREPLHVIPYPQLAEMVYLIPLFFGDKEASRFIHFGFYLLIIRLLFCVAQSKQSSFSKFAPLLFVTSPIVIRYAPSQYVDFLLVFVLLLSILLIRKDIPKKQLLLSGILLGAGFAIKMWTLIYLPAVLIYIALLQKHKQRKEIFRLLIFFTCFSLLIPLLWYIRAFLLTGNPIYPIFARFEYLETSQHTIPPSFSYVGFNWNMFAFENMIVYSPLFFFSILLFLFFFTQTGKLVKKLPLTLFFILLMSEQLFVKVDLGRYLLSWYTFAVIIFSAGIFVTYKYTTIRYLFYGGFAVVFLYYLVNTLFMLPYGLGWSDKNAYLTRVLGRDNASYYDFNHLFDKHISSDDMVATYGIFGYYYADFKYIDINYLFSQDHRSFHLLKRNNVTRLLIKGGDIQWFCHRLQLLDCNPHTVTLLATYPADTKKYNLYSLEK